MLSALSKRSTGCIDRVENLLRVCRGAAHRGWYLSCSLPRQAFRVQGPEGATYASANLRLAMLVLIWIHAIMMNTLWYLRFDQNPQWIPYAGAESW